MTNVAGRAAVVKDLSAFRAKDCDDGLVTLTAYTLMQQPGYAAKGSQLMTLATDAMRIKAATEHATVINARAA